MPLAPGQTLASYEILGPLGAGAMGEVYRARDTRLEREVAIKVLPAELAADTERLQRFEREAKAMASLNHPNVAAIYGVDREDDTCYLALELVPGEDLAQRLDRGPLTSDEAIDVCGQIAAGIEAAHEQGVVHRDLKPANVRITPEGVVKVLDFGLAKAAGSDPDLSPATMTQSGALIGTPAYMSPEQVRGRPVDRRTDIWAFGCVLFELLTGRRLFDGDSIADVLAAIVEREPDLSRLPSNTPPSLRALLSRCVDKDPRTRLQAIGEARIALDRRTVDAAHARPEGVAPRSRVPALVAVGVLAAAAATVITLALRADDPAPDPLAHASFSTLTNFEGTEYDASISPNGNFVAFASDRGGSFDIFVGPIDGSNFKNVSNGAHSCYLIYARESGFDATNSHVWLAGAPDRRVRRVSIQGGELDFYMPVGAVNLAWNADGSRVVYHTSDSGDPLFVATPTETPDEPILRQPQGIHQHYETWSLDGQWIYFVRGAVATGDTVLCRIRPDGTGLATLTDERLQYVSYPAPIDARHLLLIARERDGAGPWLWLLDIETGSCRRATIGLERYTSVSGSADGRRFVASRANPTTRLVRVPILPRIATEDDVTEIDGLASAQAHAPRFAGRDLVYLASRGKGQGLWRLRDGKVKEIVRGADGSILEPAAISPDGQRTVVVRAHEGQHCLFGVAPDGTGIRLLSAAVDVRGKPGWSPDSQWVVTGGHDRNGLPGLFKIALDDGRVVRLASGTALDPAWSPTEDLIVYSGNQVGAYIQLLAVRADGAKPARGLPLIEMVRGGHARFLPDGNGLVYTQSTGISRDFWLLEFDSGATRRLTRFGSSSTIEAFDIAADGRSIVFDRLHQNSDIVLIELGERDG